MAAPRHIVVFRFSALGDVAMCVPVVRQLLRTYPKLKVTFVSRTGFAPLFDHIDRLQFHPADFRGVHRGIPGLLRLFRELRSTEPVDAVADLHQVLRSLLLGALFRMSGVRVSVIDKGRREKNALTRRHNKQFKPLATSFERYADVFVRLSIPIDVDQPRRQAMPLRSPTPASSCLLKQIGIAPFAKHPEKAWPPERMRSVVAALARRGDLEIFLFGGGSHETAELESWAMAFPGVTNMAGRYPLREELLWIRGLDLMVSMDSANMHLASLYEVPVVSVWGATHPYAGFLGWGQSMDNVVQADMDCRPCSVFGNKPCYKGTHACMKLIQPEMLIKKILTSLTLV